MTEYIILARQSGGEGASATTWTDAGKTYPATSAKAAVALYVKETKLERGIFVAVPKRSWVPVRVQAEQKVKLKFS